jgi:hypothetical protein
LIYQTASSEAEQQQEYIQQKFPLKSQAMTSTSLIPLPNMCSIFSNTTSPSEVRINAIYAYMWMSWINESLFLYLISGKRLAFLTRINARLERLEQRPEAKSQDWHIEDYR